MTSKNLLNTTFGYAGVFQITHYKHLVMEIFDYIIVGAGSAGCVLANRLTKNPKINVLLLEAGGKDSSPWIHIPGGYFKTMHNPKTDWCFTTEKEPNCDNREMD